MGHIANHLVSLFVLCTLASCSKTNVETFLIAQQAGAGFWPANSNQAVHESMRLGLPVIHVQITPTATDWILLSSLDLNAAGCGQDGQAIDLDDEDLAGLRCQGVAEAEHRPITIDELHTLMLAFPMTEIHLEPILPPSEATDATSDPTSPTSATTTSPTTTEATEPTAPIEDLLTRWWDVDLPNPTTLWLSDPTLADDVHTLTAKHGKLLDTVFVTQGEDEGQGSIEMQQIDAANQGHLAIAVDESTVTRRLIQNGWARGIGTIATNVDTAIRAQELADLQSYAIATRYPGFILEVD